MQYVDINEAIKSDGLRIVIVKAMPSAWGLAAKAMIDFKGLECKLAHQIPFADNPELLAWSGTNSAPVVAWNDEPPVNRWDDILLLLERLAPEPRLVPEDPKERIQVFGMGHEMCGELGFGWNRRLDMLRPKAGGEVPALAYKYGYRDADVAAATTRSVALMKELTATLKAQKKRGSNFLVGDSVTAADFYWAAFSNFVVLQPYAEIPTNPDARPLFENTPAAVLVANDPILMTHREHIMQTCYELPMQL